MTWSTQYLGVSLILALCSCYQLSNGTPHDSLHLRITKRQGGSLCCSGWNFGTCEVMLPTFFKNGLPFHERNASLYGAGPSCSTNLQLTPADEGTWTCGVLIGSEWTYSDELEVNVPPTVSDTQMGTYTHGSSFHLPIPVIIGSVTIRNVLRLVLEICNHDGGNPIYSTEFEGIREGLTLSSSSDNRYALFKNDTSLTLHVNPFNTTCDNSSIVTWKFKFHLYVQHREYSSSTLISLQCYSNGTEIIPTNPTECKGESETIERYFELTFLNEICEYYKTGEARRMLDSALQSLMADKLPEQHGCLLLGHSVLTCNEMTASTRGAISANFSVYPSNTFTITPVERIILGSFVEVVQVEESPTPPDNRIFSCGAAALIPLILVILIACCFCYHKKKMCSKRANRVHTTVTVENGMLPTHVRYVLQPGQPVTVTDLESTKVTGHGSEEDHTPTKESDKQPSKPSSSDNSPTTVHVINCFSCTCVP